MRGKEVGRGRGWRPKRIPLILAAYVFPLALGHEGENLKHEIGNEGAEQILVASGIKKGHVEDQNVHFHILGEQMPLLLDFLVVSSQPVDARDADLIARLQAAEHGPTGVFGNPCPISCR